MGGLCVSKVVSRLIFGTKPISQIESSASDPRVCTLGPKRTRYSNFTKYPDLILLHRLFQTKNHCLNVTYDLSNINFIEYFGLSLKNIEVSWLFWIWLWFIFYEKHIDFKCWNWNIWIPPKPCETTLRWQIQTKSFVVANITKGTTACRQLLFSF